jgi:hypothetical protein
MTNNDSLTDIQHVRDAAQLLLDAFSDFRTEDPASLSEPLRDYASVVSAVNQRLMAAHVLLTQGRREEAIHACDADPNLLDCVDELDAADQSVEAWLPTIDELGHPRPQRLKVDLASELGAAYDVKHQLDSLMRTHRLLAISRGPIEQRVATLRRIVHMDPENPRWIEDLATYEKECKKSLEEELGRLATLSAAAITPELADRAVKLGAELGNSAWLEPLDGNAVRRAKGLVRQIRKASAARELPALLTKIAKVYDRRDLEGARVLLDRLERFEESGAIDDASSEAATVRECRDWVIEQDNAESIQRDLQTASQEVRRLYGEPIPFLPAAARRDRAKLQREINTLASLASATGDDAHAALLSAAQSHIRRLDGVGIRFWLIAITASLATIASVGGVAWWRALVNYQSEVLAEARDVIEGPLAKEDVLNDDLRSAQSKWRTLLDKHPWLSDDPVAAQFDERIHEIGQRHERDETDVRQALDHVHASVNESLPRHLAALSERNIADTVPGDSAIDAKEVAHKELRDTDRRATEADAGIKGIRSRAGDEKARPFEIEFRDLRSKLVQLRTQFTDKVDSISRQAQARIGLELDRLERMPTAQLIDDAGSIRALERQAEELERFHGSSLTSLRDRIERLDAKIGVRRSLDACTERLTLAGRQGGAQALLNAIDEELRSRSDSSAAADLRKIASERPCIDSALKWADASSAWTGDLSCPPKAAEKWLAALTRAREAPSKPRLDDQEQKNLDDLVAYLEERADTPHHKLDLMVDELDLPVLRNGVVMITASNGMTYYTTAERQPKGWYFRDERRDTKSSPHVKNATPPFPPAPPAKLAEQIRDSIEKIRDGALDYDSGLLRAFDQLIGPANGNVDPVIKCFMLRLVLDALRDRSMFTDNTDLALMCDELDARFNPDTPWVDPERQPDRADEENARKTAGNPRLGKIRVAYDSRRKSVELRPWPIQDIKYAGWTDPSGSEPTLRGIRTDGLADGKLVTVAALEGSSFQFEPVGDIRGNKVVLSTRSRLSYGRPVFLVPTSRPRLSPKATTAP